MLEGNGKHVIRRMISLNLDINKNFDEFDKNFLSNKKPYQVACIIGAFILGFLIMVFSSMFGINNVVGAYATMLLVAPLGYIGIYNKNGMDLLEYRKKRKNDSEKLILVMRNEFEPKKSL